MLVITLYIQSRVCTVCTSANTAPHLHYSGCHSVCMWRRMEVGAAPLRSRAPSPAALGPPPPPLSGSLPPPGLGLPPPPRLVVMAFSADGWCRLQRGRTGRSTSNNGAGGGGGTVQPAPLTARRPPHVAGRHGASLTQLTTTGTAPHRHNSPPPARRLTDTTHHHRHGASLTQLTTTGTATQWHHHSSPNYFTGEKDLARIRHICTSRDHQSNLFTVRNALGSYFAQPLPLHKLPNTVC